MTTQKIKECLNLLPHPEGGFYGETFRSSEIITNASGAPRNLSTAIYFLLENDNKSHFHRITSDELWFFHLGQSLEIILLQNEELVTINLGPDLENGEVLQATIPANTWFGARVKSGSGYALVSCTVSPGFDFLDFELATKDVLLAAYPQLKEVIMEMTL